MHGKLLGESFRFPGIENTILENNIYGVDINEESVEIARLSLWLRTAKPHRKLNDLSSNIKCGNSLIDDKKVAGDKAFKWEDEFPEVFKNGGFDVVIGNPPYLRVQGLRENFEKESKFYESSYRAATGRFDIYTLFLEKSYELINDNGQVSFILPHKFLISDFGTGIRGFLSEKKAVKSILNFGSEMVFSDASTYTCIINLSKSNDSINIKEIDPKEILEPFQFETATYENLNSEKWNLRSIELEKIFSKLKKQPHTVKEVFKNISQGVVSVGDDIFLLEGKIIGENFIGYSKAKEGEIMIEAGIVKPLLKGEDVKRYANLRNNHYCFYPHLEYDGKTSPMDEEYFKTNFPKAYDYILPFKEKLIERKIRYKTNPTAWYSLHRSREISLFEQNKIVTPETSYGSNMTIDKNNYFHNTQVYTLTLDNNSDGNLKQYLALLNSNLFWFYLKNTGAVLRGGYFRFKTKYLEPFPLPVIPENSKKFIDKVDDQLTTTNNFNSIVAQFEMFFDNQFSLQKTTKKLQNWYELDFGEFIKELSKAIKKINRDRVKEDLEPLKELTKKDEFEWMELFEENKKKAVNLQQQIDETDRKIDQMVYELYGLTEEEIQIVENS